MGIVVVLAVIILLVLINALYVAAEFAAVGIRPTQVAKLKEPGGFLSRHLAFVIEHPKRLDNFVATCQVGITFSSLILGAYGQSNLAPLLSPLFERLGGMKDVAAQGSAALLVLVALTVFQMVLGELVPKSVALQMPVGTGLATVLPVRWSEIALKPFIWFLNGSGNVILRTFGQKEASHRHIHSPEEIGLLIGDSIEAGLLGPLDKRRLKRAMQLTHLPVYQVMVPRPMIDAIRVDLKTEEVLEHLARSPYTRILVYREDLDDIVGILNSKAYLKAVLEKPESEISMDALIGPVFAVPRNVNCHALLNMMKEQRTHHAIVLDEYGGTEGFLTLDDILALLMGGLADEFKEGDDTYEQLDDGSWRVPGSIHLHVLEDLLDVAWPTRASTLSGHLRDTLGRTPEPGEEITLGGVMVIVEEVNNGKVISALVRAVSTESEVDS